MCEFVALTIRRLGVLIKGPDLDEICIHGLITSSDAMLTRYPCEDTVIRTGSWSEELLRSTVLSIIS